MEQKIKKKDNHSIYKMIIPLSVERKIKYYLEKFYNTEWSGILFYDCKGSLSKGLTVTCKDILVMNKGNAVFTSFEVNEEILPYMIEHELLDYQQSIIHSHHAMQTIFSSTDINTLEERAALHNNFVSLIVNNDGKYNAAITWKTKSSNTTTSLFGKEETIENVETEELYYSYMTIEREFEDEELNERIKQLNELKNTLDNNPSIPKIQTSIQQPSLNFKENKSIDNVEFEENNIETSNNISSISISELAEEAAAQLISFNLLAIHLPKEDKLIPTLQLISDKLDKKFVSSSDNDNCIEKFVDLVFTHIAEKAVFNNGDDYYDTQNTIATKVKEILEPYANTAPYISDIIDSIDYIFYTD